MSLSLSLQKLLAVLQICLAKPNVSTVIVAPPAYKVLSGPSSNSVCKWGFDLIFFHFIHYNGRWGFDPIPSGLLPAKQRNMEDLVQPLELLGEQ